MPELTLQQAHALALQHHLAGQFAEAENLYRQILAAAPEQPETLHHFGVLSFQLGRAEEAFQLIDQALAIHPGWIEALCDRGEMLRSSGRLQEALAAFQHVLAQQPEYATAHHNLGVTLRDLGQLDDAIAEFQHALRLNPAYTEAYLNLGNALQDQGQVDAAIAAYHQALAVQPHSADAYNNLGIAHYTQGHFDQAIALYQQALALQPQFASAYANLGNVLLDCGDPDSAITIFRQAIALDPGNATAYQNLGNALKHQGLLDEALDAYQRAATLKPKYGPAHSAVLFTQYYHPAYDAAQIAAAERRWNQRFAEPLRQQMLPHTNEANPERRLRIGYYSPDFRDHAIGWFLLPLLENHDRQRVEVFAYAQVDKPDFYTAKLRACVAHWRSTVGLSDQQLADLIRADQIDILVDLTMHTANNRALVFARKPAPVQVNYLAYVGSSGMPQMDYRLSDRYLDPPGADDTNSGHSSYAEETFRLAGTYWCYRPSVAVELRPAVAPANRPITFGCLNNFCKINPPLLELWAKILGAVPDSRLLLHALQGSHRERTLSFLETRGVCAERVSFVGKLPIREYYELYQTLDIALDTTPYGGGTTTCDALWMGVPVVTLAGERAVGRGGASILQNAGLPELIARTPEEYFEIAVALAHDPARLRALRATLRGRLEASPLMDAPRYAQSIEAAYRQMWRTWCEQQRA